MTNLENLIRLGEELNNAISDLNAETKILQNITKEKRKARSEQIEADLTPYCKAMERLNIDKIDFHVGDSMLYNATYKSLGIEIFRGRIKLCLYSNVMQGYYDCHSLDGNGRYVSEILNYFLDNWNTISRNIEPNFTKAVQKILNKRQEKAIMNREKAIKTLTNMN